jgi:hypothetical protein
LAANRHRLRAGAGFRINLSGWIWLRVGFDLVSAAAAAAKRWQNRKNKNNEGTVFPLALDRNNEAAAETISKQ